MTDFDRTVHAFFLTVILEVVAITLALVIWR